mgnify:FL=1
MLMYPPSYSDLCEGKEVAQAGASQSEPSRGLQSIVFAGLAGLSRGYMVKGVQQFQPCLKICGR